MELLTGWKERIERAEPPERVPQQRSLPKSPSYYAEGIRFVKTREEAEAMVQLAQERSLSHIGFDTEFQYTRPGVPVTKGKVVYDPRSVRPLLLSFAMVEPGKDGGERIYRFVVDLQVDAMREVLLPLLRLPVPFVGHFAHVELLCYFQLGLPEPRLLWDTWVHEKALHLGRNHKRYKVKPKADLVDEVRAGEEVKEDDEFSYSLVATCQRYGISYPFAGDKERLQRSFIEHAKGVTFSEEQIEYAAADAVAAAELYPLQVLEATRSGTLQHLVTVEMPWVTTNARMVWNGVRVDPAKCARAQEACARHKGSLMPRLAGLGVGNVNSHKQLKDFFSKQGLLELFRRNGSFSFDKKTLAEHRDRHPAVPLIHATRRVEDLLGEKILSGEFVGMDGRIHSELFQLGTHTGRQTCRWPNLLGLGRVFRPLIVPDPGCGIGEVDLSQIEVGVAAAVYGDQKLVEMFNTGDVYSAMAQHFYRERLSEEERQLPSGEFKRKHPQLRNQMKGCTLGIIYGVTAYGLSQLLKESTRETAGLLERFLSMFPDLREALEQAKTHGTVRGSVSTISGLRRQRSRPSAAVSNWERNWMTNHPVQGSAAVVFKVAGNRLDKLYPRYNARMIVPMHDAYVFEAPLEHLQMVADLTARTMCDAVQEYFPELQPRVEINISRPECWNKEGHADSVDRWIEDPRYTF